VDAENIAALDREVFLEYSRTMLEAHLLEERLLHILQKNEIDNAERPLDVPRLWEELGKLQRENL
jgi:hypothetical protein